MSEPTKEKRIEAIQGLLAKHRGLKDGDERLIDGNNWEAVCNLFVCSEPGCPVWIPCMQSESVYAFSEFVINARYDKQTINTVGLKVVDVLTPLIEQVIADLKACLEKEMEGE